MDWRHPFYRLQQRLALTRRETHTLAVLLLLLAAGLGLRHIRYELVPYDPAYYVEIDSLAAPAPALDPDAAPPADLPADAPASDGPIRLNTATAAELEALPRIGPRTAERIVAFREARGPFRRPEDLLQIKGIGEKTLEALRPHLIVE
ncbi:MAG: helix-hairpin-helix domain-containing protein [Rhodothermales bacterium]